MSLLGDLAVGRCGDTAQYSSCHAVRRQVQLKTGHLVSKIRSYAQVVPRAQEICASDVVCEMREYSVSVASFTELRLPDCVKFEKLTFRGVPSVDRAGPQEKVQARQRG